MNVRPLAACAALLALTACSGDSSSTGVVRLLDAVSGPAAVDLHVDGALAVGSISYAGSSGFRSLPVGVHLIGVVDSATAAPLAQVNVPFTAGEVVTVLATGVQGGSPPPTLTVFPDDDSPPASGYARLRVVHGAAGAATLVLDATLVPEGSSTAVTPAIWVPYRTAESFVEVPAGRYALVVIDAVTRLPVATFPTGALAAGSATTALVTDGAPGTATLVRVSYFTDLP